MTFSQKATRLILEFEGMNQPGRWPGHLSGITLGYGYDLGYVTMDQFESDWEGAFADEAFERLREGVGKRGPDAQALAPRLADIKCTPVDSQRVLLQRTIPAYTDLGRRTFPGFDRLPLDAQGALVSLVYNRGGSMKDSPGSDNRREMRTIRDLVPRMDLAAIAAELRSMKRLWEGKGLTGLLRRRDAEATLVESCIAPPAPIARAAPRKRSAPRKQSAPPKRAAPRKHPARKKPRRARKK
jgi:GH24 family phage-related lysozyme (muramidase)